MTRDLGTLAKFAIDELEKNPTSVVEIRDLTLNELGKLQADYFKDYDTSKVLSLSPDLPNLYLQNYILHVRLKDA